MDALNEAYAVADPTPFPPSASVRRRHAISAVSPLLATASEEVPSDESMDSAMTHTAGGVEIPDEVNRKGSKLPVPVTASDLYYSAGTSAPPAGSSAKSALDQVYRKYAVVPASVRADAGRREDGWVEVKRRKPRKSSSSGIRRGHFETPPLVEYVTDLEYEWNPKTGLLRWVKKWAQLRKGGFIGTKEGMAVLVYGCSFP